MLLLDKYFCLAECMKQSFKCEQLNIAWISVKLNVSSCIRYHRSEQRSL